jgi:hypothetical protein
MYDGTLAGHWQAIVTFQQLIILANADGVVDMTVEAIARRTTIPERIIAAGIAFLLLPDQYSRTPGEDGKRITPLDDHRPWGWRIVNHMKYRDLRNVEQKRQADRDRIAAVRDGEHKKRQGYVYFASAGADGPIKIGYSANPWARLNDLQNGSPQKFELLAVVAGKDADERSYHDQFASLRIQGEWFKRSKELLSLIKELKDRSNTTANYEQKSPIQMQDADADTEAVERQRSRGSRLSPDWFPSESLTAWAAKARSDIDLPAVVEKFKDYWRALPGSKGVKLDWDATFRNFLRNERAGTKSAPDYSAVIAGIKE